MKKIIFIALLVAVLIGTSSTNIEGGFWGWMKALASTINKDFVGHNPISLATESRGTDVANRTNAVSYSQEADNVAGWEVCGATNWGSVQKVTNANGTTNYPYRGTNQLRVIMKDCNEGIRQVIIAEKGKLYELSYAIKVADDTVKLVMGKGTTTNSNRIWRRVHTNTTNRMYTNYITASSNILTLSVLGTNAAMARCFIDAVRFRPVTMGDSGSTNVGYVYINTNAAVNYVSRSGDSNTAVRFDAVNDYIDFGTLYGDIGLNPYTIAFWYRATITPQILYTNKGIISKNTVAAESNGFLFLLNTTNTFSASIYTQANAASYINEANSTNGFNVFIGAVTNWGNVTNGIGSEYALLVAASNNRAGIFSKFAVENATLYKVSYEINVTSTTAVIMIGRSTNNFDVTNICASNAIWITNTEYITTTSNSLGFFAVSSVIGGLFLLDNISVEKVIPISAVSFNDVASNYSFASAVDGTYKYYSVVRNTTNAGGAAMYLNGAPIRTFQDLRDLGCACNMYFGTSGCVAPGAYIPGDLSDVRIYDVAFSDWMIRKLWNKTK